MAHPVPPRGGSRSLLLLVVSNIEWTGGQLDYAIVLNGLQRRKLEKRAKIDRRARALKGERTADKLVRVVQGGAITVGQDMMVGAAQLAEHQVVVLGVAGSSPVAHPF